MTSKTLYIFLLITLSFTSCEPKGPTVAERREQQLQKYKEQLSNERRTLHATDSLISVLIPQINTATQKGFEYEKNEYDELGRFRPKGMDPSENVMRTYLRCAVDDYGRTQLIATYCGNKSFVVESLRISAGDGTSITTARIAPNDGSNYSYDIDGMHYQSVTFSFAGRITEGMTQDSTLLAKADTDAGALGFIAQHTNDNKLVCYLISQNGKELKLNLTEQERKSMAATYELGILLRESVRLQQENKTAGLKIQYLEERIAANDSIIDTFH